MAMNPKLLRPRASQSVPAAPSDPNFASVSLLLHFDGSNGSTTFTDSSANALAVTAVSDGQISTSQSKFGGASLDASVGGIGVADPQQTIFSSGDFTLEFWIYFLGSNDLYGRVFQCGDYPAQDGWDLSIVPSSSPPAFKLEHYYDGDLIAGAELPENTWTHVAVTRESGTLNLFVNGVLYGSYASAVALRDGDMNFGSNSTAGENVAAFFDEVRITRNVARYTANFTPSATPFPDQ